MEHVGRCVCHLCLSNTEVDAARTQAVAEEVEEGEGGFMKGKPGEYEWEVTSGALKWWPRWGEDGEASLFAVCYLRVRDPLTFDVCVEIHTPADGGGTECPWYRMPEHQRKAMAFGGLAKLIFRGLASQMRCELDGPVMEVCRDKSVAGWSQHAQWVWKETSRRLEVLHHALETAYGRVIWPVPGGGGS